MNSRLAKRRSHRSRISPRDVVSDRDGVVETADQAAQRCVSHHLIPVVERGIERGLAFERCQDGAQDGGHPQQCAKASIEADAAERGKDDQHDHPRAETNDHLG